MLGEWMLTVAELEDYARRYGAAAAASLLLLTPPEKFEGDYEATFERLTTKAKANPDA